MIQLPMLFPGQGSQTVGMTADLTAQPGPAAEFLGSVNDTLGTDLLQTMREGPAEELTATRNAQPAIVAHSVAIVKALEARGIRPSVVAGHSVGEFAAAVAAGVLSGPDGLKVVRRRGELMFAAGQEVPGTMAAVLGLSGEKVTEVCAQVTATTGVVVLANHNSAAQVVISGEVKAVAAAGEVLKEAGARRVLPLNVSGAFHSPLLEDAAARFKEFLKDFPIQDAQVPLVANVSATAVSDAAVLATGFGQQLTAPVRWHETMESLCGNPDEAPAVILEVGPGKVLANMAKRAYPHVKFISVGTQADLDGIEDLLRESL